MSRDSILRRLRRSRQAMNSIPLETEAEYRNVSSFHHSNQHSINEYMTSKFVSELTAAHAEVIDCIEDNWPLSLYQHAEKNRIQSLVHGSLTSATLYEAGMDEKLNLHSFDTSLESRVENSFESLKDKLFHSIDAGLSMACAGIAETGTLVIRTGHGEPRSLSLVPPTNYIVIRETDLYANLACYFGEIENSTLPTNLLLISGPSKTADIQQTLAYGAHGPENLVVLLIRGNDLQENIPENVREDGQEKAES